MEEAILCIVPIAFLVVIFGTIVALRWFKHREIMAMVEKGILPEQYVQYTHAPQRRNGRGLMAWGIVMTMLGLALMAGLWPMGFARMGRASPYPLHFGPWMLLGLLPLFVGLALLIIYFITRRENVTASKTELPEEPAEMIGD